MNSHTMFFGPDADVPSMTLIPSLDQSDLAIRHKMRTARKNPAQTDEPGSDRASIPHMLIIDISAVHAERNKRCSTKYKNKHKVPPVD